MERTEPAPSGAILRRIPSIELLLERPALRDTALRVGRRRVVAAARAVTSDLRAAITRGDRSDINLESLERQIAAIASGEPSYSLRPVVNATGVILHTNLGRAPLAIEAARHAAEIAATYSNLEYDTDAGERGKRDIHVEQLFEELLGAPRALVVNNNAAAVLIALNTLADGAEVIVSRGELVEIGGAFRIPDVCAKSGALLREVGTTNRTRIGDYQTAINERTRVMLRVHPSNFRMEGFTERPQLAEMAALARERKVALMEDLGSGSLESLSRYGLHDEPNVAESLKAGVDVLTFSGDKLLGGPQAGVILGRPDMLTAIRKNPLFRALRPGKIALAALEATLALYIREGAEAIPALRMIQTPNAKIAERAQRLASSVTGFAEITVTVKDGFSVAGGGSSPGQGIATTLIAAVHRRMSAQEFARALRLNDPPIIARVEDENVLLDLRTVLKSEQEEQIVRALERLCR